MLSSERDLARDIKIPKIESNQPQPSVPLIDTGHGGVIRGRYITPGKRYEEPGETPLYEGVFNRQIATRLCAMYDEAGIKYQRLFDTNADTPLKTRVDFVNSIIDKVDDLRELTEDFVPSVFLMSLHGNGHWNRRARGTEVYTSPDSSQLSNELATEVLLASHYTLPDSMRFREDFSDGDPDKEARFDIIHKTKCPAILGEFGFMTNKKDREFMNSGDGQLLIAHAYFLGTISYLRDHHDWNFWFAGNQGVNVEDLFVNYTDSLHNSRFWREVILEEATEALEAVLTLEPEDSEVEDEASAIDESEVRKVINKEPASVADAFNKLAGRTTPAKPPLPNGNNTSSGKDVPSGPTGPVPSK